MSNFKIGDKVKIISLTNVDGKPKQDPYNFIGKTGTINELVLNDYYDCTIILDPPYDDDVVKVLGGQPVMAMLYREIKKIDV